MIRRTQVPISKVKKENSFPQLIEPAKKVSDELPLSNDDTIQPSNSMNIASKNDHINLTVDLSGAIIQDIVISSINPSLVVTADVAFVMSNSWADLVDH